MTKLTSAFPIDVQYRGNTSMNSTLPTGNELPLDKATPSKEPAATTAYSGASSQKYFKAFKALLHSWISSKIIKVFPGRIGLSVCNLNWDIIP